MTTAILELFADYSSEGSPVREEVRAKPLGGLVFEILQSPGLVLGIAAGDVIELGSDDNSRFHVKKRGGNICIQIYCAAVSDRMVQEFERALSGVGGSLDGRSAKELVFSVPVSRGFPAIERTLNELKSSHPGCEWYYGNVYDPADGVTPLDWWKN